MSIYLNSLKLCNISYVNRIKIARNIFLSSLRKENHEDSKLNKIYEGPLTKKLKLVKMFSLSTSLTGIVTAPIMIEKASQVGGIPMIVFIGSFTTIFTFITPVLLHLITKRYVTEISFDKLNNQYRATTVSLFLRKKQIFFKLDDINVPEVPGMFTTLVIKNKPFFLDPNVFSDPSHYIKIMGYDKPIDFKLNLPNEADKKVSKTA